MTVYYLLIHQSRSGAWHYTVFNGRPIALTVNEREKAVQTIAMGELAILDTVIDIPPAIAKTMMASSMVVELDDEWRDKLPVHKDGCHVLPEVLSFETARQHVFSTGMLARAAIHNAYPNMEAEEMLQTMKRKLLALGGYELAEAVLDELIKLNRQRLMQSEADKGVGSHLGPQVDFVQFDPANRLN